MKGFQTWYPHIWRVKVAPLTDTQEYADILGTANESSSLKNDVSSYKTELNISNAIVRSAELRQSNNLPLADSKSLFGQLDDNKEYDYGEVLQQGDQFPISPNEGEYFIRTDFTPNRLFVRRGSKWHRLYDNISEQTWSDRTYNASQFY